MTVARDHQGPSRYATLLRFLEQRRGDSFCAKCLGATLFDGKAIEIDVRHLEAVARRHHGRCVACNKPRLVTGLERLHDAGGAGASAAATAQPPAVTSIPATPKATMPLRDATILVVDDDEDLRHLLSFALGDVGATPVAVPTAKAALTVLDSLVCHAIVTDLSLPDHDALWLVRQLGNRPAHVARIPVIGVSGYLQPSAAAGFARWLTKPVDSTTVVATIAAVLHSP